MWRVLLPLLSSAPLGLLLLPPLRGAPLLLHGLASRRLPELPAGQLALL